MKKLNSLLAVAAMVGLMACQGNEFDISQTKNDVIDVAALPAMRVVKVNVVVPETLSVSEANGIKPIADIVWQEDPFGDRYSQVHKILTDGLMRGAGNLHGSVPVVLDVELVQFHALTQRTRYSIGGEHEIKFMLRVTNSRTGETVIPSYRVDATFDGFGGNQAVEAERAGITQKVRILNRLDAIIQQELTGIPAEPTS
ncbi:MAG: hypothetical protein KUG69_13920 [Marinosulfonomonas sp.]|nr:hypothetical protein [Marinosulfonomonas sp.]